MWLSVRMPWSHKEASAVSTHHESIGWECKAKWKNPILICFAPKAHLRNFLWWGRMEMGSMRLLDRSWQTVLRSGLRHDLLKESILNFSHMTDQFSWRRSKIGRNPHPSQKQWSMAVESGLFVERRDLPAWEWSSWKAAVAAERCDSFVLQCAWPIETHLAEFPHCQIVY